MTQPLTDLSSPAEAPWPSDRYRRITCQHIRPWRMDSDGFYVRRLTMATYAAALRFCEQDPDARFIDRYRLYVRDERTVLAANAALLRSLEAAA